MSIKKVFISTLIAALTIAAITGIIVVIFGSWSEIEAKVLATTALIGGFSLTGLCSAVLYEQGRLQSFAVFGMMLSLASFVVLLAVVWEWITGSDGVLRTIFTLVGLTLSVAHASLMLLMRAYTTVVRSAQGVTLLTNACFTAMALYPIIFNADITMEWYVRLLLVFAIITAFGTILTPILYKTANTPKVSA